MNKILEEICKDFDKCIVNSDQLNIDILSERYLNNIEYSDEEIKGYINQKMMTMMGNKRKLLDNLEEIINKIKEKENRKKLNIFDAFCGTTVCARLFTKHSNKLYTNDMEQYSYMMAKAFLQKPRYSQIQRINIHIDKMNEIAEKGPYTEGIISMNYAPKDTKVPKKDERCFYTRENALIIDTLRKYIEDKVEGDILHYCMAPLLVIASINNNTSGVMKGFHKKDGIGNFGGKAENALTRITRPIRLDKIFWMNNLEVECYNKDTNILINELKNLDVIYADPPYNEHPYSSNYHLLNTIINNELDTDNISKVVGIPNNWNKSNYNYNKNNEAYNSLSELIKNGLKISKYIILSYNNEGIISVQKLSEMLSEYNTEKHEIKYDTYKGSKNLKDRSNKVIEIMYLISKK